MGAVLPAAPRNSPSSPWAVLTVVPKGTYPTSPLGTEGVNIWHSLISRTTSGVPFFRRTSIHGRSSSNWNFRMPKVSIEPGGRRLPTTTDNQPTLVRIKIGNTTYDTATSKRLAHKPTWSSDQQLFQTSEGEFFVLKLQLYVDSQPLGPHEIWIDMTSKNLSKKRLAMVASIDPLTTKGAIEWSIKTQIPLPFRGFLLECI